jgi:hypothetical protein
MERRAVFILATVAMLILIANCLPTLRLDSCPHPPPAPSGDWSHLSSTTKFVLSDGQGFPKQSTIVYGCHTNHSLRFKFECHDSVIISTFEKCNDPLFQQDAVELFLTDPNHVDLHHYVEIEISPNAVMFVSFIQNEGLSCSTLNGTLQNCASIGINWHAEIAPGGQSWWAFVEVPYEVLYRLPKLINRGTIHKITTKLF